MNDKPNTPRTETKTLASAMHVLARDIQSNDGVANAAIQEAGERLLELDAELTQWREMAEELEKSVKRLLPYVPKGNFMPSADIADTITKFNQLKGQAK